ncbi:inositol phosphorylceramide glucuronosyltransferase 1-like, partial [Phalaenopsis equestris]|uniref:inositol phosphorylceramide glucuronosyltransferase 1-like n=1 Tax=Phalaenopsis equestris TaxID=78828 RepID=UPI0009E1DC6E
MQNSFLMRWNQNDSADHSEIIATIFYEFTLQNVRVQLKESLPGTGGGTNPTERMLIKFLFACPLFILLICYYRPCLQANAESWNIFSGNICDYARRFLYKYRAGGGLPTYSAVGVTSSSLGNPNQQFLNGANSKIPSYLGPTSIFFCFTAALLSLAIAFIIIPRQVTPWTGLLLMYEWTFVIFFILFGTYLRIVYNWGRLSASQAGRAYNQMDSSHYDSGKGHQRHPSTWDTVTCFYGAGLAFLAVTVPSLPFLFGISALFS